MPVLACSDPAVEGHFQLHYGSPAYVLGLIVTATGLVSQAVTFLSAYTDAQFSSANSAAAAAAWVRIASFGTVFLAMVLLGKERYIGVRGQIGAAQRFLMILGMSFRLQPLRDQFGPAILHHRVLFVHLTCIVARMPAKWYWLGSATAWLTAVVADYADKLGSCHALLPCYTHAMQQILKDPYPLVSSIALSYSSVIHLVHTVGPGLVLTYLEGKARTAWLQRQAAAAARLAAAQQVACSKSDAATSSQKGEQHQAGKQRADGTCSKRVADAPSCGDRPQATGTVAAHPAVTDGVAAAASRSCHAALAAQRSSAAKDTGTATVAAAVAAHIGAVAPPSAQTYSKLDVILGSQKVLEIMELASKVVPAVQQEGKVPKWYKGQCKINTASVKVAAAHADITTLGPLLQSCLLTALDSHSSSSGNYGQPSSAVSSSVVFQGCVQLLAYIVQADQREPQLLDSSCTSSSQTEPAAANGATAAQLLALVQDKVMQQHKPLPPISVVWGNAASSSSSCDSSSSATVDVSQMGSSSVAGVATPTASVMGCYPLCIAAGHNCNLRLQLAVKAMVGDALPVAVAQQHAGAAGDDVGGMYCSSSRPTCRLLVSQNNRVLKDTQLCLQADLQVDLPALGAGVLHIALLPTEGSMWQQLTPVLRHSLLVLPEAAAIELQERLSRGDKQQQQQEQCDSLHALATDVAYLVACVPQHGVTSARMEGTDQQLSEAQVAVLKQVLSYLASIGCWKTMDAVVGAVAACRTVSGAGSASATNLSSASSMLIASCQSSQAAAAAAAAAAATAPLAAVARALSDEAQLHCGMQCSIAEDDATTSCSKGPNCAAAGTEVVLHSKNWLSHWWQLLVGFSTPGLEAAYVSYVAQGSYVSDAVASVYHLLAIFGLGMLTDPLEGSTIAAKHWEVASRAVAVLLLVVPNALILLFRQQLMASGRRGDAIVCCEWCSSLYILALGLGVLTPNATVKQLWCKSNPGKSAVFLVSGVTRAVLRQARARRLIAPTMVDMLGSACFGLQLGAKFGWNWLCVVAGKIICIVASACIELWHRHWFLQKLQQGKAPGCAAAGPVDNLKVKSA